MDRLLLLAGVGFVAQLVDGVTGMAYGVISATLMLAAGVDPATVSASVHLAKLPTTLMSGLAHWRFGNVCWPLVAAIAVPGVAGALTGARFLGSLPGDVVRPGVSAVLLLLGGYVLLRFSVDPWHGWQQHPERGTPGRKPGRGWRLTLGALALVAGFIDAVGGGGWGPLMTAGLLARARQDVRSVVGSVECSKFLVAIAASAGLLIGGHAEVHSLWVVTLGLVGSAAAPLAAWLATRLPGRLLGTVVGGLIVATHAPRVLQALRLPAPLFAAVYGVLGGLWAGCAWWTWRATRVAPLG